MPTDSSDLLPLAPYPLPRLRVTVNFPSDDGSTPDSIEVEVNDETQEIRPEFVAEIVNTLARVARSGQVVTFPIRTPPGPQRIHTVNDSEGVSS